MEMTEFLHGTLQTLVILWIAAGFLDWICHRHSHIETTAGIRESLFHLLQLLLVAAGFTVAIFLPLSLLVIFLLCTLWSAHQFLTWFELKFVAGKRNISPLEQMIHSFMEILPLTSILFLAALLANPTFQLGTGKSFAQRWDQNLRFSIVASTGILIFIIIPFLEEFFRCFSTHRKATEFRRSQNKPSWQRTSGDL